MKGSALKNPYWIWYPGDMELYYAMVQNFSRVERGMEWPAFWKSEGFRHRVAFERTYILEEPTMFFVNSNARGFVLVGDRKYPFGQWIKCNPGTVRIRIHVASIEKFPSIYIEGNAIISDGEWLVEDYDKPPVKAGYSRYFTKKNQDPAVWEFDERIYDPIHVEEVDGGVLYEFETELTAQIEVILRDESRWHGWENHEDKEYQGYKNKEYRKDDESRWDIQEKIYEGIDSRWKKDTCEKHNWGTGWIKETELSNPGIMNLRIFCGESREEALDMEHCYYSWVVDPVTHRTPCCAVRFAYIPEVKAGEYPLQAIHQYVDIPTRSAFASDDERLNEIWRVAEHTFKLCSGIFFIDGIKRDKWIWCGDAYQSFFVNQYLMADPDINRRTLLALRGNDPMTTHINTIVDYSLFWVLGVKHQWETYQDTEFLIQVLPKLVSLMEFIQRQLDERGFLVGRPGDWIYIDWAELDKDGPLCAEQMLLFACYRAMGEMLGALNRKDNTLDCACQKSKQVEKLLDSSVTIAAELYTKTEEVALNRRSDEQMGWKVIADLYLHKARILKQSIDEYFWDEEQHAYIDSFTSGRRHVTRHGNIFGILFGIADEAKKHEITQHVLLNDKVPAITTPYFKFYELDALCQMGHLREVLDQIRSYWGGMLDRGAVTFWEEYDPKVPVEEQYDMYGDRFGKSLCHAWAASPIYLLGKYFAGVQKDFSTGEIQVRPHTEFFRELKCRIPVGDDECVQVTWKDEILNWDIYKDEA